MRDLDLVLTARLIAEAHALRGVARPLAAANDIVHHHAQHRQRLRCQIAAQRRQQAVLERFDVRRGHVGDLDVSEAHFLAVVRARDRYRLDVVAQALLIFSPG